MKSPDERGPLAAWAYEARVKLNLSPEATVRELGRYNPATIRKAETLDRHMSRPLWRALTALYPRIAHEKGISIPIPPGHLAGTGTGDTTLVPADLAVAIRELVAELQASRLARADLEERVGALETAAKLQAQPADEGAGVPPVPPVNAR